MDQRLKNACAGKSASQGGLNLTDIIAIAKSQGHSGAGSRPALLKAICSALGTTVAAITKPALKQAPAHVAVPSNSALKRACEGKGASAGGMNLSEIKSLAKSMGHSGKGTRPELLVAICSGLNAPSPKAKAAAPARQPMSQASLPPLPRGSVKVNTEQWLTRKPKTQAERVALMAQCGNKCFLEPSELKYPVCSTNGNCDIDCDGVRAAYGVTAILHNRTDINPDARATAARARDSAASLGKKHCGWN
jgi:hypothetical protein